MGGRSQAARSTAPRTPTATMRRARGMFASGSSLPAPLPSRLTSLSRSTGRALFAFDQFSRSPTGREGEEFLGDPRRPCRHVASVSARAASGTSAAVVGAWNRDVFDGRARSREIEKHFSKECETGCGREPPGGVSWWKNSDSLPACSTARRWRVAGSSAFPARPATSTTGTRTAASRADHEPAAVSACQPAPDAADRRAQEGSALRGPIRARVTRYPEP